jgi:Protein of unknown function (DUF2783)
MADIGQDRLGQHGDNIYDLLMAAHVGLSPEDSARLNARLVLLLINAVGDEKTLCAIIARAQKS